MTRRFTPSLTVRLKDDDAERVRKNHDDRLSELAKHPAMSLTTIKDVELADGVATPVPHTLGRIPTFVTESTPRGAAAAGRIDEIRDGSQDRTKFVVLKATGYGATITVDVEVR